MGYEHESGENNEFERIFGRAFNTKARDEHVASQKRFEGPHPDQHRANGGWAADGVGTQIRFALLVKNEAKRLGAIVVKATGDPKTGRLVADSMAIFSQDELEFE